MLELPFMHEIAAEMRVKDILRFLKARFGILPVELSNALQAITEPDRLDELVDLAATCPDLETFRSRLNFFHVWGMGGGEFVAGAVAEGLRLRPDPDNNTHGFVEPESAMSRESYRNAIHATQDEWVIDES